MITKIALEIKAFEGGYMTSYTFNGTIILMIQIPVVAIPCGFKSLHPHQKRKHLLGAFLFAYKGWQKGSAKEYPTLFDTAGLYRKYSKKDVFET